MTEPPAYEPPAYGQPAYGQPAYGAGQAGPPAGPRPASMWARLGGRVIDGLILSVPAFVIFLLLGTSLAADAEVDPVTGELLNPEDLAAQVAGFAVAAVVFALVFALYEIGFIAVRGATPGKMVVGVKVVDQGGAGLIGWGRSFVRWLVPFAGSLVCGIGQLVVYLSPFLDDKKMNQGWHDKAARDYVVTTR